MNGIMLHKSSDQVYVPKEDKILSFQQNPSYHVPIQHESSQLGSLEESAAEDSEASSAQRLHQPRRKSGLAPIPQNADLMELYKLASETPDVTKTLAVTGNTEARGSAVSLIGGLYALILVILAFALEISRVVSGKGHYEGFYIYLYGVGLGFLIYCQAFLLQARSWKESIPFYRSISQDTGTPNISVPDIMSRKRKVTYSAPTAAGSLYLRLGCVVFGIVGMIYFGLDILSCASHPGSCEPTQIVARALGILFIFIQMYFIFQNSKLTIQRFKNIARVGMMHLVAANLCVWIRYLVIEGAHIQHSIHQAEAMQKELSDNSHAHSQELGNTSSLVAHVAGKEDAHGGNHGDGNGGHHGDACSSLDSFQIDCHLSELTPFMTTCIVEYSIICAVVMFVLWKNIGLKTALRQKFRKQNFSVDCSSSTKGLFLGLLFVIVTIVVMIMFFIKMQLDHDLEAMWILAVSNCIIYVLSISSCLGGLHFLRQLSYVAAHKETVLLLDDLLLFVGLLGQLLYCIFKIVATEKFAPISIAFIIVSLLRMAQVLLQTFFILAGQRIVALTTELQKKKPGRELVTFLLMVNLALFLINTFETQKASVNPMMTDFYGQSTWTVIVHSTVPLNIFFRFHSSVCLAEIWKSAYRVKTM